MRVFPLTLYPNSLKFFDSLDLVLCYRLKWLQQRDEDKKDNERSKNDLESHLFETQNKVYSKDFITYSSEEERKTILDALKVTQEWLEEDGYEAATLLYQQKLRELKRLSRPVFRRLKEALQRPKLLNELLVSLNRSYSMVLYMRNMTDEIFTKVEIATLEDLTMETLVSVTCCMSENECMYEV